jgi:hypothetical protein
MSSVVCHGVLRKMHSRSKENVRALTCTRAASLVTTAHTSMAASVGPDRDEGQQKP